MNRSCSSSQKPSKGNTCLPTDWFLFIGAVIEWLRHPHYPEIKLKDPGRAQPSVWLLWSQSVRNSGQGTRQRVHAKNHPPKWKQNSAASHRRFGFVWKPKNSDREEESDSLPPTCCFACGNLLLHRSGANHNTNTAKHAP